MKLAAYKKKRSFNKTPEPTGGKADSDTLRFVIQNMLHRTYITISASK